MEDQNADVKAALRRLVEIGWAKGSAFSEGRGLVIDWTDEGLTQIGGLHSFLSKLGPVDPVLWQGIVTLACLKFGEIKAGE